MQSRSGTALIFVIYLAAVTTLVWASCISECDEKLDSAIAECKMQYDNLNNADDLQKCIDSAKEDHQSCVEHCHQ
jgi:hypothetical protein